MNYNWNWNVFWQMSPDGTHTYLETLLAGLGWTVATALSAWVMALILGIAVGVVRTLPQRALRALGNAYVELFRNIPLLVQMFLWFFVLPELLPTPVGDWLKALPEAPFVTAVVCLGFFTSARVAVQVSAGIDALSGGQRSAAIALGLSLGQVYRLVLLPLSFRIILPPLTSESMNLLKNSSVAFAVSIAELTMFAMQAQEETSRGIEIYLAVTALYALSAFAVNRVFAFIEKKARIPGFIVAGTGGGH